LWDIWRNPETGSQVLSCTMIVTEPNAIAAEIHDRMPVLLRQGQFEAWLCGEAGTECLKAAPNDLLQKWPVSRRVNSSKAHADDPSLIEEVVAQGDRSPNKPSSAGQQGLFRNNVRNA
jgi:putative SOS response-associated peptidase YedK